jgi:hypothetical protein
MTAAGGNGAGRGSAGDDSSDSAGAAGAPPMPEGGVRVDVYSQKVDPNRSCPTGMGLTYRIGDTLNGHLITNGTQGVVVSCKIVNHGDGTFDLQGAISGFATTKGDAISYAGTSGTQDMPNVALTFSFASHGTNDAQESDMTMSYHSADLGELEVPTDASPCTLMTAARAYGFLLGEFECPLVVPPANDSNGCKLEGTVDFNYCDSK